MPRSAQDCFPLPCNIIFVTHHDSLFFFFFLVLQVRHPNAIALVDVFNYTDHFLGSVLGRYDHNVYPKLYEESLEGPSE